MYVGQFLDRLEFYDDFVLYDQVQAVSADVERFIRNRYLNLSPKWNLALFQLTCQCFFVNRFEETGSKRAMYLKRRTENPVGNLSV